METVFIKLLNMSVTASWIVFAVIILRFIFKKAPKWITGVLWAFVALRLICPFSFESALSIIPGNEPVPQSILTAQNPEIDSGLPLINQTVNPIISDSFSPALGASANPIQIIAFAASVIWIIGMALMIVYAAVSFLRIHKKVREAAFVKDNIWECDNISTPFILGIFRPKIYLPSSMDKADAGYVLSHEKAHLKRKDHIWKPLGFMLLTVYWFNPVLWIAYILLCRDIELACDEKVIKELGTAIKKPYSNALINCSVPRRMICACPLAFGEVGVKARVKGVLSYKKPAFWIITLSIIACIISAICLLTNPAGIKITQLNEHGDFSRLFDNVTEITVISVENSYDVTNTESIIGITDSLKNVKIKRNPVSISLADNRDMTNRITINNADTLCFSEDCSELWIFTGVKPTFSHKVLNPSAVKNIFKFKNSETIKSGFTVTDKGSDIPGVSISVKWAELDVEKSYIEVEWKNSTKNGITFSEVFDIEYLNSGKYVSCASDPLYFDTLANILPANESRRKSYDVAVFDLSKKGKYRFKALIDGDKYAWIDFELSDNSAKRKSANALIMFYKNATAENDKPEFKDEMYLSQSDLDNILSALRKEKWYDDNLLDRVNHKYNGGILYNNQWIYFGYEQNIIYYDHYLCEASENTIQLIKKLDTM